MARICLDGSLVLYRIKLESLRDESPQAFFFINSNYFLNARSSHHQKNFDWSCYSTGGFDHYFYWDQPAPWRRCKYNFRANGYSRVTGTSQGASRIG